jgi:hypothetical protein
LVIVNSGFNSSMASPFGVGLMGRTVDSIRHGLAARFTRKAV